MDRSPRPCDHDDSSLPGFCQKLYQGGRKFTRTVQISTREGVIYNVKLNVYNYSFRSLTPNSKEQIILSCSHISYKNY